MHDAAPLVSVVIPVFNGAPFLGAALESVAAQDYPRVEVIVVDDGSTDDSAGVAATFPGVRVLQQANQGPAAARNAGVAAARGTQIAFLDADDVWLSHKLSAQVRHLLRSPQDGFVACRMRLRCESGFVASTAFNMAHWQSDPVVSIPSALLVQAATLEAVGPFDPQLRAAEDFDWVARARDTGFAGGVIDEVLLEKRMHAANLSLDVRLNQAGMFAALRKSAVRKQQAGRV
ncbi:MAG: glycosyltransferase family A protein [bacterium]